MKARRSKQLEDEEDEGAEEEAMHCTALHCTEVIEMVLDSQRMFMSSA